MNKKIESAKAPAAIGPYSQGICAGNLLFVSGQLPIDRNTGKFPSDDIAVQTAQSLENVRYIVESAGFKMSDIVKTSVFLADINDFAAMNEVYAKYFSDPFPARCAFQVAALPKAARVEIEVIASK